LDITNNILRLTEGKLQGNKMGYLCSLPIPIKITTTSRCACFTSSSVHT